MLLTDALIDLYLSVKIRSNEEVWHSLIIYLFIHSLNLKWFRLTITVRTCSARSANV